MEELNDIQALLNDVARRNPGPTRPGGWYSREGDCLFYYNEDVPHFAQRVDELLTLYRAEDNRRIVGVQIKALKSLPQVDAVRVRWGTSKEVEVVELILLTYRRLREDRPAEEPTRKDLYFDACASMVGERVRLDELQLV